MPTDPQVRATQDLAVEFKKLNRTIEAFNANFVTFVKMLEKGLDEQQTQHSEAMTVLQTTTPTRPDGGYFNAAQQQ